MKKLNSISINREVLTGCENVYKNPKMHLDYKIYFTGLH